MNQQEINQEETNTVQEISTNLTIGNGFDFGFGFGIGFFISGIIISIVIGFIVFTLFGSTITSPFGLKSSSQSLLR